MTEDDSVRRHFEAILGRDVAIDPTGQEVVLRDVIASYSWTEGQVTSRHIGTTGQSTKACRSVRLLDVSGMSYTGSHGTVQFELNDYFCGDSDSSGLHPMNFVATPRSRQPVLLTAMRSLTAGQGVQIEVMTWDATGNPAPNIPFDWRCRMPRETIVE